MKKLFIIAVLFLSLNAYAQKKVVVNNEGNYTSLSVTNKAIKDKETGKFFIDSKGLKYPVYVSSRGNLYYLKTAKESGNVYKVYIKTN